MTVPTNKGLAVITGASSGIGAVYADRFAKRGYDLLLIARDAVGLSEVADRLTAEAGCKVETITADLTVKSELQRVEDRLLSDVRIEVLVNCAGFGATAPLVSSNVDEMDAMIQVNVTALTRLTHAVLAGMLERASGTIINIASIAAIIPESLNGVYGGSKAYVVALTQSLHHEVGEKGIQVQAVCPGATATGFWSRAGLPVTSLPESIVMPVEEMVDAALSGLDQHELVTFPALPQISEWENYNSARLAMMPNLSRSHAADRYK